ncbi:MAG: GNAT family N-acetyltransferase [Rubrivivax sp.]|nr:GNAT family N-acetyltransferase [Rubrivivax sp.]
MSAIPSLSTPRLRLRPHTLADLDAHAAICADEEVMRHIGTGGPVGRDAAWRHLALYLGQWALLGHGMWAVEERAGRRLIGCVGFLEPKGWPGCELAWTLARGAWGQGYAFEAVGAARAFGRDALGIHQPISLIREANIRSIRLAERLGASNSGPMDFLGGTTLVFHHP